MSASTIPHEEHRDDIASKLGMWLFIFTELLLFGGLFITYAVFRHGNLQAFNLASQHLDVKVGTINTYILLISSMTIAMSTTAIQKKDKRTTLLLIGITVALALAFLVNKYFEWGHKFHDGLYPGSPVLEELGRGDTLFFGLYFFMTGLHALHIIIGMVVLLVIFFRVRNNRITFDNFQLLENGGLYWHLVDIIWIFLFPLFYLITIT
jgi:cytochrome c oxidase subunit III